MEQTQEEKRAAFIEKADKNKANFELHKKLISEALENWSGLKKASIDCPECKKKGCGFCNGDGSIYFYPSPDAYDHIEISRAKWRISQQH